jgi:hypothetical protein
MSLHFCEITPPVAYSKTSTLIFVKQFRLQIAKTGLEIKVALSVSKVACWAGLHTKGTSFWMRL